MLNNIFKDFASSPLNTTANVVGVGISIKFLDIAKQSLDANKQNLELNQSNNKENKILLEELLNTNKEIINLLNIIISNQNNN